jgi:ABC-2 type transport system permease protein
VPIFDQGYQHWSGQLAGHAWRWLAITRHGVRVGRSNRILRVFLLLAWLPAIALAFMLCVWGLLERKSDIVAPIIPFLAFLQPEMIADPRLYRLEIWTLCYHYFLMIEMWLSMILILIVGPSLISQDLRFNALPLYFSRPLRRIDYFLGKLGIIVAFLGMVIIVPSIIAYVLGLLFSLDISIIRDTFRLLLSSILYGLIIATSAGLLVLALSSLSRNSRYVVLFWLGIWFIGLVLANILLETAHHQRLHAFMRKSSEMQRAQAHDPAMLPEDQRKARRAFEKSRQQAIEQFQLEELRAANTDWRPLVSYTANLSRLGRQLVGSDAAWQKLSLLQPPAQREYYLSLVAGPQYPWYWSATVLAGLFGISAWILNSRVKSLDRLK